MKIEFVAGPYKAPKCKVGSTLECLRWGKVKVVGFSKTPVPWPMCEPPAHWSRPERLPILCGDLVRAMIDEAIPVVMEAWGIGHYTVVECRKVIAGVRHPSGLWAALALKRMNPEFRKKYGYPELS